MRRVILFGEDYGHETVVSTLLRRLAEMHGVKLNVYVRSARGGYGKALSELQVFMRELQAYRENIPDLIVVALDANCTDLGKKVDEIKRRVPDEFHPFLACAVPEPHVERWLLDDPKAFKFVLGEGCKSPSEKCKRDRYKQLLREAIRDTGVIPLLGGLEYAEDLIKAMDFTRARKADKSLGRALDELERFFKSWRM